MGYYENLLSDTKSNFSLFIGVYVIRATNGQQKALNKRHFTTNKGIYKVAFILPKIRI